MRAPLTKLLIVACALLAVLPVSGSAAQPAGGATIDKEGWWNALSGAANPPESPLRGTAPNPAAPAPEVPEGAIAVAARLGQTDKVAALGIVLEAGRGGTAGGDFEAPPIEGGAPEEAAAPDAEAGDDVLPIETTDAQPAVNRAGETFGNFPGVVPFIALLGLLVALLAAWTLGSGGTTSATPRRQGGVSRALAARTEV